MIFKERYKNVFLRESDISNKVENFCIENNVIKGAEILVTGHFGNTVSIRLFCENIVIFPLYNSTNNIGFIIRALIELLDKESEDGTTLGSLKDTPIRLIFDNKDSYLGKCIGIGNFMKDRFVLTTDLLALEQ